MMDHDEAANLGAFMPDKAAEFFAGTEMPTAGWWVGFATGPPEGHSEIDQNLTSPPRGEGTRCGRRTLLMQED
jgi:hypothetical protein